MWRREGIDGTIFDYHEWMARTDILCHAEFLCIRPAAFAEAVCYGDGP